MLQSLPATAPQQPNAAQRPEGEWRRSHPAAIFARRFIRHKGATVGGLIMLLLVLMAIWPEAFAPYDPLEVVPEDILAKPGAKHWFGTDTVGRDMLSRIIHGTRYSLRLGVVSVSISLTVGVVLGTIAGYLEGWVDTVVMRLMDILLAFPGLLLTMLFIFTLGPSLTNAMIAVGIAGVPGFARVTRGEVLAAKNNLYVEAARATGASDLVVMFRHVLPNVIAPSIIIATLRIGTAILYGASLSYLGLGVQDPTPEWGRLISDGRGFLAVAWWMAFFPGAAIAVTVLGMNLLGDGLRDLLDPRLRH